jgi:catechol 2,3-dioxygenase-like lactoylglutathione lyase family enzyme
MDRYVDPKDQLIFEIYTKDMRKSIEFYQKFGFAVLRRDSNFAELGWEASKLYLEEISDPIVGSSELAGNIRIMVPRCRQVLGNCE